MGFLEEFFHTIKQWMRIKRPQEDQIDYKITRRTNWSRGIVTKKNRISDQFIIIFITSLDSYESHEVACPFVNRHPFLFVHVNTVVQTINQHDNHSLSFFHSTTFSTRGARRVSWLLKSSRIGIYFFEKSAPQLLSRAASRFVSFFSSPRLIPILP